MKLRAKITTTIVILLAACAAVGYIWTPATPAPVVLPMPVPVLTAAVVEEPVVVLPTTGSVSVTFPAQPTKLPGNYADNGMFLRAWAEENKQSIIIPMGAKNVRIGFTFAKTPKTRAIAGNLQLSLDGKNFCNGRLTSDAAVINLDTDTYRYSFDKISTQDKPKGVDLSSAVGKTLNIKVWIGENKNYVESVTLNYDL